MLPDFVYFVSLGNIGNFKVSLYRQTPLLGIYLPAHSFGLECFLLDSRTPSSSSCIISYLEDVKTTDWVILKLCKQNKRKEPREEPIGWPEGDFCRIFVSTFLIILNYAII